KTDNTWNIEVTGDADGSNFRGKIVGNQAIQNLTEHGFEASDSVWHTDASRHSIEFSMIAGQNSTDGISFNMPYEGDATLYLEMENGENIAIELGSASTGSNNAGSPTSSLMSEPISAGLELNEDSLLSGKPNYTPSEQSGIIVWNTDDVWHMEATGTPASSHYRGRIISDQPIEDLSVYNLESNDVVQYADESHQAVEFAVAIANQWTDGMSFKATDGASVFLELENSDNVPVQAGANMQEINLV
ncbi:MAG: hypothetical protein AAFQ41_02925, partial [Cyanobacteria bacterium J06623_7]